MLWYLWLSMSVDAANYPVQSVNFARMDVMVYQSAYLPTWIPAALCCIHKACTRLGRAIAKASKLITCIGRVALEEELRSGEGCFIFNTFQIELTLAWFIQIAPPSFKHKPLKLLNTRI